MLELCSLEDDCPVPTPVMKAGAATQRSPDEAPEDPCFASSCDELRLKDVHGVIVVAIVLRSRREALGHSINTLRTGITKHCVKYRILKWIGVRFHVLRLE